MIGILGIEIEIIIRLGKVTPNRARPLLVKMMNVRDVRAVMQVKSRLRGLDGFNNVYIERDLTVEEREVNRNLRRELIEKRDEGKSRYIIRGGKVLDVGKLDGAVVGRGGRSGYTGRASGQRGRVQGGDQLQTRSSSRRALNDDSQQRDGAVPRRSQDGEGNN